MFDLSVDLHMHSFFSDGALSPEALVEWALNQKKTLIALTDHDTIAGSARAVLAANAKGLTCLSGIEISTNWQGHTLHVLGLGFDLANEDFNQHLLELASARQMRAKAIATRLEKAGVQDIFDVFQDRNEATLIGRLHFAQFLLKRGYVKNIQSAFTRYLGRGKVAYEPTIWPELKNVIEWLHSAGGVAVLAHPVRYRLTMTRLRHLVRDFKALGGEGLELIHPAHAPHEQALLAKMCIDFDLAFSVGSDYHGAAMETAFDVLQKKIPEACRPIWNRWL